VADFYYNQVPINSNNTSKGHPLFFQQSSFFKYFVVVVVVVVVFFELTMTLIRLSVTTID